MKYNETELREMLSSAEDRADKFAKALDIAEDRANRLARALADYIIAVGRQTLGMPVRIAETLSQETHRATTVLHETGSIRRPTVTTLSAQTGRTVDMPAARALNPHPLGPPSEPVVE